MHSSLRCETQKEAGVDPQIGISTTSPSACTNRGVYGGVSASVCDCACELNAEFDTLESHSHILLQQLIKLWYEYNIYCSE